MSTYLESIAFCDRQELLWKAEKRGLQAASASFKTPPSYYSPIPEIQHRYELGFTRGKEQLAIEGALAHGQK